MSTYKPGQELVNSNYGKEYSLNEQYKKKMVFPIWADGQLMEFRVFPAIDPASGTPLPMEVDGVFSDWICPIRNLVRGTGITSKVSMILNFKSQQSGPYEYFYNTLRNIAGWSNKVKDPEMIKLLDGREAPIKSPTPALLFQGVVLRHGEDDMSKYAGVNVLCLTAKSARQRFDRLMLEMAEGKAERHDLVSPADGWAMRWSAVTKQQQIVQNGEVMTIQSHYKLSLYGPVPVQDPRWFSQWTPWENLLVESSADEQIKLMQQIFPPALLALGLNGSGYLADANTTARTYSVPPVSAAPTGGMPGYGSMPGFGGAAAASTPSPAEATAQAVNQMNDFFAQKSASAMPNAMPTELPPLQPAPTAAPVSPVQVPPVVPPQVPPVATQVAGAAAAGPAAVDPQMAAILKTIEQARAAQGVKA